MQNNNLDFTIRQLGECRIPSPMKNAHFTGDDEKVLYNSRLAAIQGYIEAGASIPAMEVAGPRQTLFFDPAGLKCGIVTCGGICPGLNDVIRAIVLSLYHHYGVHTVYGFRFGYEGLVPRYGHKPLDLTPEAVSRIYEIGGTILGSSRGPQDPAEMVDYLEEMKIGILFAIGGDGTLRGAQKIAEEAAARGLQLSVIGIPKTIDNDVSFVQATFGFETAVSEAKTGNVRGNAEAESARNGIGLVKLMGRDSGFIAAYSVLASNNVNFCLIPEVPFTLDGFLKALKERLERRNHAVVVVAEGAGQGSHAIERGARRVGEHQVRRHRHIPSRCDQGLLPAGGQGDKPQVHRPELYDKECSRESPRFRLLPSLGTERRPCRHERTVEYGRELLEPSVYACSYISGGPGTEENRSPGHALGQRHRLYRSAGGNVNEVRQWGIKRR